MTQDTESGVDKREVIELTYKCRAESAVVIRSLPTTFSPVMMTRIRVDSLAVIDGEVLLLLLLGLVALETS